MRMLTRMLVVMLMRMLMKMVFWCLLRGRGRVVGISRPFGEGTYTLFSMPSTPQRTIDCLRCDFSSLRAQPAAMADDRCR